MNEVNLIGNVGQVISDNKADQKGAVLVISLATSRKYIDKSMQEVTQTEWHKVVCFGVLACRLRKVIEVGQRYYINGRIQYSNYQDKEGKTVRDTSIIVNNLIKADKI